MHKTLQYVKPLTITRDAVFNPFPGLRPFTVDESHLFFGREGQSEELLQNLATHKFVAVLGASGSGKSSLMYCGLVPTLYGGFITDAGSRWKIVTMRPGAGPLENLAKAIVKSDTEYYLKPDELNLKEAIVESILRSSSLGLVDAVAQMNRKTDENILIMVDQFEELFRYKQVNTNRNSTNESIAFVKMLLEAVYQKNVPIYIVLTMRSDFIGECAQYQELTRLINDSHYLIPQMTRDDMRKTIEGPIAVGGGKITPHLVHQLLNDIGDKTDQLPILQHALMRTWDYWMVHREGEEPIDIMHYIAIGRMEKALSEHANEAFSELSLRGEVICETIFKALTELGGDNRGIRRPSSVFEIMAISGASLPETVEVIEKFQLGGRSFIISSTRNVISGDTILDISHESLMRIWDKLKIWVEEESRSAQMYLRLADSAERNQVGKIGLWRPPDLHLALNWRDKQKPTKAWALRYSGAFERTMQFLANSEAEYIAEEQNKIKLQKRALRRSRIFAIILGTATLISLMFMLYAIVAQVEAEKQRTLAESQKILALENEQKAVEALRLAQEKTLEAERQRLLAEEKRIEADTARQRAIQSALEANQQRKIADTKTKEANTQKEKADSNAKVANYQKELAESATDNALKLRMQSIAQSMAVKSMQIDRDTMLRALMAYQAHLFNTQYQGRNHNQDIYSALFFSLKLLKNFDYNNVTAHNDAIREVIYNPKNNSFYSVGADGRIYNWTYKDNKFKSTLMYEGNYIFRCADISSNGKFMVVGTNQSDILLLSLYGPQFSTKVIKGHKGAVWNVLFSNDDNNFYSVSDDNTLKLWSASDASFITDILSEQRIRSMAINPVSHKIIVGTDDGKILIPNSGKSGMLTEVYYKNSGNSGIFALDFNQNGDTLSAGELNGNVLIFDFQKRELVVRLTGQRSRITDIEYSPDNKLLSASSLDGTIYVWNTQDYDEQPIILKDENSWVWSFSYSAKSDYIVSGFKDGKIQIWPTRSKQMAEELSGLIKRNFSAKEWSRYIAKDIEYRPTFPNMPKGNDSIR